MKTEIKDYFEVFYWAISLLILVVTVYWIKQAPLLAVQIGRKLDNEQNKDKVKRDLFLMLFSLRGNPKHHSFVNGLNQIDVVFEDSPEVLYAWRRLFDSLHNPNQNNAQQNWDLLRVELLSEMAQHLGYQALKQTEIQKSYIPHAHAVEDENFYNYQIASKNFFESGTALNKALLENINKKES